MRKTSLKVLNCIGCNLRVPALVIDTPKLALNARSFVEELVVLIDKDVAPVGDFNSLLDFGENKKSFVLFVVQHHFIEGECFNIFVRAVLNILALLISSHIRGEEAIDFKIKVLTVKLESYD